MGPLRTGTGHESFQFYRSRRFWNRWSQAWQGGWELRTVVEERSTGGGIGIGIQNAQNYCVMNNFVNDSVYIKLKNHKELVQFTKITNFPS